ncbi:hypothetical protein, partial [Streptomyces mirabilis]|uniref:hypothetical protein n=1 Tax=Streptomyces mirabilis TaxID=68239 RepID=UPI0033C93C75
MPRPVAETEQFPKESMPYRAAPALAAEHSEITWFLRGCPGLQAGKESDSCGAGQGTGFRLQGERPST